MQVNSTFVQNKYIFFEWGVSVGRCDWHRLTRGPIGTPFFASEQGDKKQKFRLKEYMKDRIIAF